MGLVHHGNMLKEKLVTAKYDWLQECKPRHSDSDTFVTETFIFLLLQFVEFMIQVQKSICLLMLATLRTFIPTNKLTVF